MNKVARKQFYVHLVKDHPDVKKKLKFAYTDMIESWDNAQEILRSLRYSIVYDKISKEI